MPPRQLRPFLGEFADPALEAEFRLALLTQTAAQQRLSLQLIALLFVGFGVVVDLQVIGLHDGALWLAGLRILVAVTCLLLAGALGRHPRLALCPAPLNAVLFLLVTVSILIVPFRPGTADVQITAAVATVFTLYLVIPNRLIWAAAQGAYMSLGFLLINLLWRAVPLDRVGAFLLVLLVPNLIGYLYALRFSRLQREQYASFLAEREARETLQQEISERRRLEEELRQLAQIDDLTGLNNRRWFLELADKALRGCRRRGTPLSVCMIDLDHFKTINDRGGHSAGDHVLALAAGLCLEELRESDIIGRFGGEEFIMALPDADAEEALLIAERLRHRIERSPLPPGFEGLRLTATLGVSQVADGEDSLEPALLRADAALYNGKRAGRNIVRVASATPA